MKMTCEDILLTKEKIYCFANNLNVLYSIERDTGEIEYLISIPGKDLFEKKLISKLVYWNGRIYLLPLKTGSVWMYELKDKEIRELEIESYADNWADSYFRNALISNNKLFIFGGYYPAVVILDLNNGNIEYDRKPFENVDVKKSRDLYFRGDPIQIGEEAYFASGIDNSLFIYNLSTGAFEWRTIGNKENRYSGIIKCEEGFLLSPRKGNMNVVKVTESGIEEYKSKGSCDDTTIYTGIIERDDGYLIPTNMKSKKSLLVDSSWQVHQIDEAYTVYKVQDNTILKQIINGDIYVEDNKHKRVYSSVDINDKHFLKRIKESASFNKNQIMYENDPMSLNEWIAFL